MIERMSGNMNPDTVDQQIVQFFAAFDKSQVEKI